LFNNISEHLQTFLPALNILNREREIEECSEKEKEKMASVPVSSGELL